MEWNAQKARKAIESFSFGHEELIAAAEVFYSEMEKGLQGNADSTLKPLPSYLGLPTGDEQGEFITLDFGGTNVRAERVRLFGGGHYKQAARVAKPLIVSGRYNHAGRSSSAEGLFGFLAEIIDSVLGGDHETPYRLGHTFSFPSTQDSPRDAKLISWTKELAVPDVEGCWVNEKLNEALLRRGLSNVHPTAILNDTVAVFLAAAYQWDSVAIGSIYATGFNACYLENFGGKKSPMVMNLEAGNFGLLDQNEYDIALDSTSEKEGAQALEKMVSGRYLGMLFSRAFGDILGEIVPALTGEDLCRIIQGEGGALLCRMAGISLTADQIEESAALAEAIVRRSARIAAAVYVGMLHHIIDRNALEMQNIAIEGSFFSHMAVARVALRDALQEILKDKAKDVQILHVTGGASLGAAIAAAMIEN